MMNLLERFLKTNKQKKSHHRKEFSEYFFSLPEHNWIKNENCRRHFENLFLHLPIGLLDALVGKHPVTFLTNDFYLKQRNLGMPLNHAIIIFPKFQKLLESDNSAAVAYLAHELAFVLYELEETQKDPLRAEIEADKFVCDVGLSDELETFLLMLDETQEKRLRLTYLTLNYFTQQDN